MVVLFIKFDIYFNIFIIDIKLMCFLGFCDTISNANMDDIKSCEVCTVILSFFIVFFTYIILLIYIKAI